MLLSWYRRQLKEHGSVAATRLLVHVVLSRVKTTLANKLLPVKVLCPCCGWEGRRFFDYIEVGTVGRHAECPRCNSHPRHRALYLWLRDEFRLRTKSGIGLIFAPERALEPIWQQAENLRLLKTDIETARGVDVLADLQRLPFSKDSVDLIWCHHVLQLIEDDRSALKELARVLRPQTGELILSVAIVNKSKTQEYGFANKDVLYFWRMYGDDFRDRLAEAGFKFEIINGKLSAEDCQRYGINHQEEFYLCVKNHS